MGKKPKRKYRKIHDPWEFYKKNYDGLSRSNLRVIDESLYKKLRRAGLLERIPIVERENYGDDLLRFYDEHFSNISKSELSKKHSVFYRRLQRKGLLSKIPSLPLGRRSRYGENPLEFYNEHYDGITRGKLSHIDNRLYLALKNKGLLEHVPLRRSRYGENPLEFYNEHYDGITRGKLSHIDNRLYRALKYKGLLKHVPLMRS